MTTSEDSAAPQQAAGVPQVPKRGSLKNELVGTGTTDTASAITLTPHTHILKGTSFGNHTNSEAKISLQTTDSKRSVSLVDILKKRRETISWFWGGTSAGTGLFPEGKIIVIGGATAEGKSTLIFTLVAHAVSGGRDFLGYGVQPIERALIVTETDEDQVSDVFKDAVVANPERVEVIFDSLTAEELEIEIAAFMPEVLVIDSLSAFASTLGLHGPQRFDWNSPQDTTIVIRWFRKLQSTYGLKSLIVLAHTNKPGKDKEGKRVFNEPHAADVRGSGGIMEQVDVGYILRPSKNGDAGSLTRVKTRKKAVIEKLRFSYDVETGMFIQLPDKLTEDLVLSAVKSGTNSKGSLTATLPFRKADVLEIVNQMIADGKLTENNHGKSSILLIP